MLKVLVIAVYSLALRELLQVGQLDWMHTSYKQSFDVFAAKFQVSTNPLQQLRHELFEQHYSIVKRGKSNQFSSSVRGVN